MALSPADTSIKRRPKVRRRSCRLSLIATVCRRRDTLRHLDAVLMSAAQPPRAGCAEAFSDEFEPVSLCSSPFVPIRMAQQIYRRDLHGRNAAVISRSFLESLFRCESKHSLLCPENGNQISLSATNGVIQFSRGKSLEAPPVRERLVRIPKLLR